MPKEYTTKALADGLASVCGPEERILIPRAAQGSRILTETLADAGLLFRDLPVYDIETEDVPLSSLKGLDYITFESGSGVRGFFKEHIEEKKELLLTARAVCIGQVTKDVLEEYGVKGALVAKNYTADGIAGVLAGEKENGNICI